MNVDRVVIWLMANNANAKTLCFDIKTTENPENSWKHGLYNEVGINQHFVCKCTQWLYEKFHTKEPFM